MRERLSTRLVDKPGYTFRSTNLDLALATLIALGIPFAAEQLLTITGGAALSLLLYYGVCCIGIVLWRKGTLDYRRPLRWPWLLFGLGLLVDAGITFLNYGTLPNVRAPLPGFLLTLLLWVPLNSALEQLSWVYVLDSWRNRWSGGTAHILGLVVGLVLLLALIGMIHVLFWIHFLPTANTPFATVSLILTLLLTVTQVGLYYRSGSMWPTWIVHFFSDLQLVLLAHYSILPALFHR